jgi:hypothetical protein
MNCDCYDNDNDDKDDESYNDNDDDDANDLGHSSQFLNVVMVKIIIIIFGVIFQVIII